MQMDFANCIHYLCLIHHTNACVFFYQRLLLWDNTRTCRSRHDIRSLTHIRSRGHLDSLKANKHAFVEYSPTLIVHGVTLYVSPFLLAPPIIHIQPPSSPSLSIITPHPHISRSISLPRLSTRPSPSIRRLSCSSPRLWIYYAIRHAKVLMEGFLHNLYRKGFVFEIGSYGDWRVSFILHVAKCSHQETLRRPRLLLLFFFFSTFGKWRGRGEGVKENAVFIIHG